MLASIGVPSIETCCFLTKPDVGVDAPAIMRNFLIISVSAFILSFLVPQTLQVGSATIEMPRSLRWLGGWFLLYALLFLLYVKVEKFFHRDFMHSLHAWRGE